MAMKSVICERRFARSVGLALLVGSLAAVLPGDAVANDPQPPAASGSPSPLPGAAGSLPPPPSPRQMMIRETEEQIMSLTPDEIREFRNYMYERQKAAAQPPRPLKSRSASVNVSLDPGAPIPKIEVAAGRVSTLVFYDVTGQPWPIDAIENGDPGVFDVKQMVKDGPTLTVTPKKVVGYSNVAVLLKGQATPVMIDIYTGEGLIDSRRDVRIMARGPAAVAPVINAEPVPPGGDAVINAVLDGVPPANAVALRFTEGGGQAQAWMINGQIYVRTTLEIMSPNYAHYITGSGRMKVFVIPEAPVVLALDPVTGKRTTMRLATTR
jgi:intracellular multiplication protein IcmK